MDYPLKDGPYDICQCGRLRMEHGLVQHFKCDEFKMDHEETIKQNIESGHLDINGVPI